MAIAPTQFPAEPSAVVEPVVAPVVAPRFERDSLWRRLIRHRLAQIGAAMIAVLFLVAMLAPVLSPIDSTVKVPIGSKTMAHIDPKTEFPQGLSALGEPQAPNSFFRLGADTQGRDVLTRTLYGARISLLVGVCAMISAVLIGTSIGLVAGYFGGWVDVVLMRLTEVVLSLPTILLAIALVAVLPDDDIQWHGTTLDRRIFNLLLAITLVTWTGIARTVRGQVMSLKQQEFIESARAIGCSHARIIFVHLLPNVLPTIVVLATLATAHNILLEAGLSYLGLGVQPATPSWGAAIADGQPYILSAPWLVLAPGIAIVLAVAGFNFLGQALQETLEPRS